MTGRHANDGEKKPAEGAKAWHDCTTLNRIDAQLTVSHGN
jgi:hypothetical protein